MSLSTLTSQGVSPDVLQSSILRQALAQRGSSSQAISRHVFPAVIACDAASRSGLHRVAMPHNMTVIRYSTMHCLVQDLSGDGEDSTASMAGRQHMSLSALSVQYDRPA